MELKIALAGNPNSGKTTLFNALTGSNQFVGNWPGVTVEKKEGRLKSHKDVIITDLPGIYSLSPYTLEEVVARNYLVSQRPDAILNIIDGTNLERSLYLTTQLAELGIPMVVAINMMDAVKKSGDKINTKQLAKELGCQVVEVSALKGSGVAQAADAAIEAARQQSAMLPQHSFSGAVEHAIAHIEEALLHDLPEARQRWYAVKLFERDEKIVELLKLPKSSVDHIEQDIKLCEQELDDDAESIITTERYTYIDSIIHDCYLQRHKQAMTISDKIDRVVTNRFLALPIFAVVMFLVYFVSVTTVGDLATNWANDGVFGDGWHLLGIGTAEYEEASADYELAQLKAEAFLAEAEAVGLDTEAASDALASAGENTDGLDAFLDAAAGITASCDLLDNEGQVEESISVSAADFSQAITTPEADPADFGVWVPGIPVLMERGLNAVHCADWLQQLILDGIVAGVGAVLGFVPQMLILFLFLAFLEACGYMARIAFIMDRIFRKFGLSGKSFIPMLIGTGCGVPGIMASRTIENVRDRRMTIITTTFIPCGAKLPVIALIAGALFGGAWWVAPSAYFVGIGAIITSGIMLKKTKLFSGDPAPFVMELPAYHWPTVTNVLRSMWERGWSFIKKAGTIILLATIFVWFTSNFGFTGGSFGMVSAEDSILAAIGSAIAWVFAPLGWGSWKAAVAAFTGLIAKENIVGTLGILAGLEEVAENGWQIWTALAGEFTALGAYSFLVFNLLCAPCFAAIGAIRREMNSAKWTWFAIGYQCGFAYAVALVINQLGLLFAGHGFGLGTAAAIVLVILFGYMLFRKDPAHALQGGKVPSVTR